MSATVERHSNRGLLGCLALVAALALGADAAWAAPEEPFTSLNYQGELLDNGVPITGTIEFKFVVYESTTTTTVWSNDGTSVAGSEPAGSMPVEVVDGLFTHRLGSAWFNTMNPYYFSGARAPKLRVWVDLDGGFVQFPDQALVGAAYAHNSYAAERSYGTFVANDEIWSQSGGFKFPDGTVQATAATGGGVGGNTLDQAYDQGGAGIGRTIVTDAGWVDIQGSGGLRVDGPVGIGTISPGAALDVRAPGDDALQVRGRFSTMLPNGWIHANIEETGQMRLGNPLDQANSISKLELFGGAFTPAITLDAPTGAITGDSFTGTRATLDTLEAKSGQEIYLKSSLFLKNPPGEETVYLSNTGILRLGLGFSPMNGVIYMYGAESTPRVEIFGSTGSITLDSSTRTAITMSGANRTFKIYDGMGDLAIDMHGDSGRVTARTVVADQLQLTGGADLAEPFPVSGERKLAEGTVVVIDETNPGHLRESTSAYDRRVAGVVSGAGGVRAGITLAQDGVLDEGQNVALTGRVYVRADTSNGPITAGDLLTTSTRAGHAMKATDRERSGGAVLGKAMTSLESGAGLVLILVNLQ